MRLSPEKIQTLKESDGWKAVEQYVLDRLAFIDKSLEEELKLREVLRLQGAARELRRLLKPEEILK